MNGESFACWECNFLFFSPWALMIHTHNVHRYGGARLVPEPPKDA